MVSLTLCQLKVGHHMRANTASQHSSQLEFGTGLLPLEVGTKVDCALRSPLWQSEMLGLDQSQSQHRAE